MRVALCFWGLCRSTHITHVSIEKYIFSVLKNAGIKYDVYLHTYTFYRAYTNFRANEINIQLKNTNWKLLKPIKYCIEHQDTIDVQLNLEKYRAQGDPWKYNIEHDPSPFSTLDNHIRALWSLNQVTNLWTSSDISYDRVIYLRPDVEFMVPFNINWITSPIKNTILIPSFQHIYNCNDRFAIGTPEAMKLYGERFHVAYQYSLKKSLHSEGFLADYMNINGYTFSSIPFSFRRIRADGRVQEGDRNI